LQPGRIGVGGKLSPQFLPSLQLSPGHSQQLNNKADYIIKDMCNCKIQWVNSEGEATPDENPAVGIARIEFRSGEIRQFPICSEHLKKMPQEACFDSQGRFRSRWTFIPF